MHHSLTVSPAPFPHRVRSVDGTILEPPEGWELLPPGDAALTRRVKKSGPTWTIIEKRGRKSFSRGVWAPAENIAAARRALEAKRSTPAYERELELSALRRQRAQAAYEAEFERSVLAFLDFAPPYAEVARRLAREVTRHAAPVGSGTVARAGRLSLQERGAAAVIAWLRHRTTEYDTMRIARVKGRRREVRQQLARQSHRLLDAHRHPGLHGRDSCSLCRLLAV